MKKRLGEMLKTARERANLKQNEAAKKAGIHNSTLAKYESGKREPDIETIYKLAAIYDITPESLVTSNNLQSTFQYIEAEAQKLGLSATDPAFKKILADAFEILRVARGKNNQ